MKPKYLKLKHEEGELLIKPFDRCPNCGRRKYKRNKICSSCKQGLTAQKHNDLKKMGVYERKLK